MLFLPTYAATAWYHRSLPDPLNQGELAHFLKDVEPFAINDYTALLAKGENLDEPEKERLAKTLHTYTGLPEGLIEKRHFRINWVDFTRHLLEHRKRIVGRMDTTITGIDPDPRAPFPKYDPSMDPLYGPFSSAMNAYVRDELRFESDRIYEFLNMDVNERWDWSSGLIREQGFIDVSHRLRDAMAVNNDLDVWIASDLYDLATPYFAAK
jgi:carboxypeptidase C (cathepsin A)